MTLITLSHVMSHDYQEGLTLKELWCSVWRTSAKRVKLVSGNELVAEPEIRDLDVHLAVQEQVLGFQITMDDFLLVTILNGGNNLERSGLTFNNKCSYLNLIFNKNLPTKKYI